MKFIAITIILLLNPRAGHCRRGNHAIENAAAVARKAAEQLTNPALSSVEAERLREEKAGALKQIESIGNAEPKDVETQLEVSKSLASVSEAPRAVPYAERGLRLAETSGDPKMIREALLTGSEVYYKAGNYDLARARAERILKDNPKDKDALALYMQVKGRGAAASPAPKGGSAGSAAGGAAGRSAAGEAAPAPAPASGPGVAMTSASSLEAQKQIALGWSRITLDPAAALKNFEAAITADPKGAATRVQRSKARLQAGDARGALGDARDAIALQPGLGEAYAARAEAHRALGLAEADLLADYEEAARLDGRFTDAYKTLVIRTGAGEAASGETGGDEGAAASAPAGPLGLLERAPRYWGALAFLCAMLAAAAGIAVPLALKRRRSGGDGSLPR